MKKLLLGLISIFTFGIMFANATLDTISRIDLQNNIETFSKNDGDLFQDGRFIITPNPSKDKLNIRLPKTSQNMTLEVYDVLGKRIHKSTITQLTASVDVSRWKTGVYLVKVSSDKDTQTKRFVKQ
ncbi:T9SS type A sorting domain-containing protein [Winogradskyella endarachnes]|uniref:T9SS type A sorting domain-containing protein n=1 Tax=Winogradskyella endarachnes TaxID=2681965 RepID=A0A6L6UBX7_9FLAO|nr:T9SS type A sorting domain-containing protein [Winogradskyella endarachnes]MUU78254.1 T9SS type A sorting domain-containing protein [Winogradskyella endarachnes]